jgi:hypothetical protein
MSDWLTFVMRLKAAATRAEFDTIWAVTPRRARRVFMQDATSEKRRAKTIHRNRKEKRKET